MARLSILNKHGKEVGYIKAEEGSVMFIRTKSMTKEKILTSKMFDYVKKVIAEHEGKLLENV